ncbi:MAG TPA: photosystem I reaction center subunit XII [Cyanothece sp. UBA12306]|nr:photosystem I reaction center subunit XII [Cyanothece sp. UBA12306]
MESKDFDLSLEQQFEMKRMRDAAQKMSREQALELLMQASRLLMIKTNVVRNLANSSSVKSLG